MARSKYHALLKGTGKKKQFNRDGDASTNKTWLRARRRVRKSLLRY
jgi:hypothetical protein